jgi:hypothetical protein
MSISDIYNKGEYFPFMESEGIDRRHAILEISTEIDETGYHYGEVFDIITHQTVWRGESLCNEIVALEQADGILQHLEHVNGFGSISLYKEALNNDFN